MNFFKNLKTDLPASFVVFLVALPLSLGIALASGAPIKAGIIAAVIGGVAVGLFGGAPLQVSGPAAGLTVMVFGFIQKFGFEATCIITLLAGGMQILLGALGVGQLTLAISPSVIEAMLAGIGILIALGQTYVLLGTTPKGSALANLANLPETFVNRNHQAFALGAATLLLLWGWYKYLSKKIKFVPGSLVAVVFGTIMASALSLDIPKVSLGGQIFESFAMPQFSVAQLPTLLLSALALTIVASAESLLCAVATDKLHSGPRALLNKELIGQGIANSLSGLFGGLPVTGVIVRSSANINAGAKSKLSAIMHGVWLFLFASFMTAYLSHIPLSVLAALLIFTGVNLVKLHEIKKLMAFNEALIYFVTLSGVVFINLLWGIGIGFGLALVMLIYKMSQFEVKVFSEQSPKRVVISGSLTFLGIPSLVRQLDSVPTGETLEMVLNIDHLDHASLEAIRSWKENYEKTGGKVIKTPLDQLWKDLGAGKAFSAIGVAPSMAMRNHDFAEESHLFSKSPTAESSGLIKSQNVGSNILN
jgi:carbonic anhydrase